MTRRLEDRVVFVTGGSRGLGRAIALGVAAEGARLVVGYRKRDREAREIAAEALRLGARAADAVALDVRDPASVEGAIRGVLERSGRIDGLVCSAGVVSDGWLATLTTEQWNDVLRTNLDGTMHAVRAVLRPMMAQKRGSIVLLASVAALRASPGQAAYAASKGGIVALATTVAAEVAPKGIRVNVLAPGLFDAGMVKATPPERVKLAMGRIPFGRLGDASEIVGPATFLLSDDASYVTGHVLSVDGGLGL